MSRSADVTLFPLLALVGMWMVRRAAGRVGVTAGSTSAIVSAYCGDAPSAMSASAVSVPARAGSSCFFYIYFFSSFVINEELLPCSLYFEFAFSAFCI